MEFLTDPIANMERIHKSNFAYQKLLELQGKSEKKTELKNVAFNQQDLITLKNELNELNLEIFRK